MQSEVEERAGEADKATQEQEAAQRAQLEAAQKAACHAVMVALGVTDGHNTVRNSALLPTRGVFFNEEVAQAALSELLGSRLALIDAIATDPWLPVVSDRRQGDEDDEAFFARLIKQQGDAYAELRRMLTTKLLLRDVVQLIAHTDLTVKAKINQILVLVGMMVQHLMLGKPVVETISRLEQELTKILVDLDQPPPQQTQAVDPQAEPATATA